MLTIDQDKSQRIATLSIRFGIEPAHLASKAEFAGRRLRRHRRLKVQLLLRGAEPLHPEAGTALLHRFADMIDSAMVVESISLPKRNLMEMVLVLVD
jgi:translation initiation factor IF-3